MEKHYEIELAGRPLIIESGRLAQQAGGAVTVRYGDTMVLGTATASNPRPGIDFFPLTVEFEERLYAAGRIPGSFFRREGRPTTTGVLSARLTDRPLRPLFPKGYADDTQVILTVLSADMETPPDTLGTIAASAALTISDIPFEGPVGAVRIGYVNDALVVQPTFAQLAESQLNLVVSGTKDAIMMVEADADEVSEEILVEALALGQEAIASIVVMQEQLHTDLGKPKRPYTPESIDAGALARVEGAIGDDLAAALSMTGVTKAEREARLSELRTRALDLAGDDGDAGPFGAAFSDLEGRIIRANILERGVRPDQRSLTEIRPLSGAVGMVPRTHGSGLFERGETQVLSLTTLAGTGMAQRLDDLTPADSKRFMHHYNFSPFSTGETGRVGSPSRRSIGHGMLGERAMQTVLPSFDEFPYTIRIVSEVLSSNGSTSMASICASILSMMDAGVPLQAPMAGIAMGLIKGEGEDEYAVLTDIAGLEDHLGDMDFKVAGTREGVSALQMDIKVKGITTAVMGQALSQARDARLQVLDAMKEIIAEPRTEMSRYAPRMLRVEVPQEKIGAIIGPGGKTIRSLEEKTGASIDIESDGSVFVSAPDEAAMRAAADAIRAMTKEVEPGEIYTGKVTRLMNFGAFVEILPGKDALVHISELADYRVASVEDIVKVGDEIMVQVTEIDNLGRINASRRAVLGAKSERPCESDREGAGPSRPPRSGGGPSGPRDSGGPSGPRDGGGPSGPRDGGGPSEARDGDGPSGARDGDGPSGAREGGRDGPSGREEREPEESSGDGGDGGDKRRRRRRRRKPSGPRPEPQPDSTAARRPLAQTMVRRAAPPGGSAASDERPGPPPPPRPDFGAPQR